MPLEDCLVAIWAEAKTEPVGAGFLIGDRLVATCAHVVNAALGHRGDPAERPQASDKILVRFRKIGAKPLLARVAEGDDAWSPPPASRELGADFCLLTLEGELPESALPADLGKGDLVGQKFRTAGFPKNWDFDTAKGDIDSGDEGFFLLRPDEASVIRLLTHQEGLLSGQTRPPGIIYRGFSGGPVEVGDAVVGMMVEAREIIKDTTSYMLPVSAFPKRFSESARQITSPNRALVTKYLTGVSSEIDPTENFIDRKVRERFPADPSAAVVVDSPASKPPGEFIADAVARLGKIVLLGEPGLGKSTALKHLETDTAKATLRKKDAAGPKLIPIRIEFKKYEGDDEFESQLAARVNEILKKAPDDLSADVTESTRIVKEWLKDGAFQFLIILDALDEVSPMHHAAAVDALKGLLNYPHRFVISCRTANYNQSLDKIARQFVLIPLGRDEVAEYLGKALGEKGMALFREQVESNAKVLSLASNALFLNMIVEISERDIKLPRNRGLLFRGFVKAMNLRRLQSGDQPTIPIDIVETAMRALGAATLDRKASRPGLGELRRWKIPCDGQSLEAILAEARKYRFLLSDGSGGTEVEFIHPLFREYFAAEYLNELADTSEPDFKNEVDKRFADQQWREAIIMLAGFSRSSLKLVPLIAARLKADAASGQLFEATDLLGRVFGIRRITQTDWLMQCWDNSASSADPAVRNEVVDALRAVIQHAGPALNSSVFAGRECDEALRAVQRIGATEAIPDIDELLTCQPKDEKKPGLFPFGFFSFGLFQRISVSSLLEQARAVSDELKKKAK
jgi:hypothetical protein